MMFVVFSVFVLFSCATCVSSRPISANPLTRALEDSYGRERLFHGVNVVYKSFPFFPITDHFDSRYSLSEEDLEYLEEWGMNVVRLGVMWGAVEPIKGAYNMTYLGLVQQLVANMSRHGIFALIDFHQDALSEKFCGEGVPLWAAQPSNSLLAKFPLPIGLPYTLDASGVPSAADCAKTDWSNYYPTAAASTAFQHLYDNHNGLLDSFALYWQKLASVFKGFDNVIGYDLFNEPWAGDIYANPSLLLPTIADIVNLAPMYDRLNTAIRQVDNEHLIFFEPVTWDDFGVGFHKVPGGDLYKNRSVLSYHIYVPPSISIDESFFVRNEDLKRLGCGGFLGEFDLAHNLSALVETADQADLYQQSWTGWEYKVYVNITGFSYAIFQENGTIDYPRLATISRTYPMAVAGRTNLINYTDATKEFVLQYTPNIAITQPTDIYLNERINYPNGYNVTIQPSWASWNASHNHVYIWNNHLQGSQVTVQITAN